MVKLFLPNPNRYVSAKILCLTKSNTQCFFYIRYLFISHFTKITQNSDENTPIILSLLKFTQLSLHPF